ncbi:MAG TPA: DUF5666 domain-containing protein [Acidobacteriaceae bacterium]|nr:DUF5666 domain-containing protein [Acidobacteriaceae bacterium]
MMRLLHPHFSLAFLLTALAVAPHLRAQQPPPQEQEQADGRGPMSVLGPNGGGTAGTVTAIAGSEITIKNEQGETYKIATSPNTHFRKDREEARLSDIKVGDTVMAAGNLDDQAKTIGAVFVALMTPEQAARMRQMRADFGKTWTVGRITAIHDLTLTIERPDKVTQTITVDENTAFRRGGRGPNAEDITFPDIKVGDNIRATGALQGENFLAANLVVLPPGAIRIFRRRAERSGEGRTQPQPTPQGTATGTAPASPQN